VKDNIIRIAMWSGPRNISTAMMRSFEARGDTYVTDEAFYSHYLLKTGIDHPGRNEIIAGHESDWKIVVEWLTGSVPGQKLIWYQKHMAHHMLPNIDIEWTTGFRNCFLIREPREVLISYTKKRESVELKDTGFQQQVKLFDYISESTGVIPAVVDAKDVLEHPESILSQLCEYFDIDFTDEMLKWEPGLRETDGVWAKHWYDSVEKTTGFGEYRPKSESVPSDLEPLLEQCRHFYSLLHNRRIRP